MNTYIPNQFSSSSQASSGSIGSIEQKVAQLNQSAQQTQFQNVQQYMKSAQINPQFSSYRNTVEQNAKNLRLQDARNYIQQMNNKIGLQ